VSTLEGIALKTKSGMPRAMEELVSSDINAEQYQQYLLCSNNFIIHALGLKQAAKDIIARALDRYGVK